MSKIIKLIDEHSKDIVKQYKIAKQIEMKFLDNEEIVEDTYNSSIIDMCIRFESFTSDLYEIISGREPRYNHPWANIRMIASKMSIDIKKEYKVAHDMWDYYNTLKHINSKMNIEKLKLVKEYEIKNAKDAANKVLAALKKLLLKLRKIKL